MTRRPFVTSAAALAAGPAARIVAQIPATGTLFERRWLALGDSITMARDVHGIVSYPELMRAEMEVINGGMSRYTSRDLLDHWAERTANPGHVDVVSVMLGTNDHFAPDGKNPRVSLAAFGENLAQIVYQAREIARVVVCAAVFVATTPDGQFNRDRLTMYNAVGRRIARQFAVPFVDTFARTAAVARAATFGDSRWISLTDGKDGVHPVTSVHAAILDELRSSLTAVNRALRARQS